MSKQAMERENVQKRVQEMLQYTPVMTYLKPLKELKCTPFDNSKGEHIQILNEYWELMKPLVSERYDDDSKRWQSIGFQGKSPETDFRAMGLLAPICLRYMAKKYPDLIKNKYLMRPYPFSCAGINIIRYLADQVIGSNNELTIVNDSSPMLKLMCNEYKSLGAIQRSILIDYEKIEKNGGKISSDCFQVVLFEELFCILFELFDSIWVKLLGASKENNELYFEFGRIFQETRKVVDKVLKKNIPDYSLFRYFLLDQ